MRVVIDTNVWVSGILNPHGPPGQIVDAALSPAFQVLYDDRILSEYREVLLRPIFGFPREDVRHVLDFVESAGERITAKPLRLRLPDASDAPFAEVAIAGMADALVTGNVKPFPQRALCDVQILSPAQFLRLL